MVELEVYVPESTQPLDLVGYTAYVLGCIALDTPVSLPDYLLVDDPQNGIRTEISHTG